MKTKDTGGEYEAFVVEARPSYYNNYYRRRTTPIGGRHSSYCNKAGRCDPTASECGATFVVVTLTVRANNLNINDVEINRGNCKWGSASPPPWPDVRFGQSIEIITALCQVIEVVVKTNMGEQIFTWDE